MTANQTLEKIALALSPRSIAVQSENLKALCDFTRGIAMDALEADPESALLSACRDALALLANPDAEAFDADAVTATLERAIANAERGGA